jgi:tripartite-type tricarboxylate transporter receptor subunit TctC
MQGLQSAWSAAAPCVFCVLCAGGNAAIAQEYPIKPIRTIVAFAPGGPADLVVRPVAQKLYEMLGQPVVIDYRAGANGVIGAELVAKSPPDGYTLLSTTSGFTMNPNTFAKLPYDTIKDFAPVSLTANSDIAFMVNPVVPARSIKEFIAVAKARKNTMTYASSGTGGSLHLGGEMLKLATGIDMLHVPYKGASVAMADVIGGHVDVMFISVPPAIPQVKSGKLRALATASAQRARGLPDVPTFAELGYADFEVDARYGLVAPAGTPRDIVAKLSATVAKAAQTPELKERYAGLGLEPISATPEQFAEYIRRDIAKWRKVVAAAKIKPQ